LIGIMNSKELIKKHEGLRLKPYKDTEGVLTIGYGRNLEKGISAHAAEFLFEEDMLDVRSDCLKFDWFHDLPPVRQAVIENMMFNLGINRFSGFKKMIKAIEDKDWHEASVQMLSSRWADQVGNRAIELANMMNTGEWG